MAHMKKIDRPYLCKFERSICSKETTRRLVDYNYYHYLYSILLKIEPFSEFRATVTCNVIVHIG